MYHNCSTRFADGFRYGRAAAMGSARFVAGQIQQRQFIAATFPNPFPMLPTSILEGPLLGGFFTILLFLFLLAVLFFPVLLLSYVFAFLLLGFSSLLLLSAFPLLCFLCSFRRFFFSACSPVGFFSQRLSTDHLQIGVKLMLADSEHHHQQTTTTTAGAT